MSGTALERAAEALCLAQSGVSCYHDLEPEAQESAREHVRTVLLADDTRSRVLAWLGYWRDKIPAEAVTALQEIVRPLE